MKLEPAQAAHMTPARTIAARAELEVGATFLFHPAPLDLHQEGRSAQPVIPR